MQHILVFVVLAGLINCSLGAFLPQRRATVCNGHTELCDRNYANVTVVGAHDSFAFSADPLDLPRDQRVDIPTQLSLGVRLLQAQAHMNDGVIHFCHTSCILFDGGPVVDYLKLVKAFLDNNPNEVITFIFTNPEGLSIPDIWKPAFDSAGITPLAYVPPHVPMKNSEWPTLGEMIDSGKRVVVFLDSGADTSQIDFILPEFEMIWETPFSVTDPNFPCSVDRISGPLSVADHSYMINHSLNKNIIPIGDGVIVSDPLDAPTTNSVTSIVNNVNGCVPLSGANRKPQFLLLDFVDIGQGFAAANQLNGLAALDPRLPSDLVKSIQCDCGGTVIEYDHAAGNGFCVTCGTVIEENTIVNEIVFSENANGAAIVQGSFVAQGATHARMGGPYGNRGSSDSREQTIENATKKIQNIANVLRLSEVVVLAARRMYTLAVEHKFTKGRKSLNVVAVCLYVACRQKETRNYMLIDFSDLLQVNVFELGHTYLQLVQTLNLRLPLVDPSHYISRFAALLEFGDETHKVATDATSFGICGAALLLAARMNNFRRSVEEIVQVVKIADTTLKKRLDEFKNTPSGSLTLADFRSVWLDEEMDPPAFTKGREREEAERRAAEAAANGAIDPLVNASQIPQIDHRNIDPTLLQQTSSATAISPTDTPTFAMPPTDFVDETVSDALAEEVSTFLQNSQGVKLSEALDEAEQRRLAQITVADELMGLDEEELDCFILNEEEVRIKERVWVELNRDYLEAIAAKGEQPDSGSAAKSRKKRRTNKPRDTTTPSGSTAAESVRNLIKKNPKYSKRINYDALKDLFVDNTTPPSFSQSLKAISDDKDEDDLYTMGADDKSDDEGTPLVIIQEAGTVALSQLKPATKPSSSGHLPDDDLENGSEDEKYDDEGAWGEDIKRINYDALKDLFVDNTTPPSFSQSLKAISDDKDEDDLYTMGADDKSDDEGTPLVIIQEAGTVALSQLKPATKPSSSGHLPDDDLENGSEDEKYDDEGAWGEDMYEQEI
ncbi:Transcription factor IIIB 60 kDa subunit [Leucoagaricus sp. SymC.cos]|nr:Transcription factor IIIB 60 kDa subunit [Leucoagaricus sp. SymC.cos]